MVEMGGVAPPSGNARQALPSQACLARVLGDRGEQARAGSRWHKPCRLDCYADNQSQARLMTVIPSRRAAEWVTAVVALSENWLERRHAERVSDRSLGF